jgi:hypothetical protein
LTNNRQQLPPGQQISISEFMDNINSKIGLAKEELDIVLDSSKYFKHGDILKRCINTNAIRKIEY